MGPIGLRAFALALVLLFSGGNGAWAYTPTVSGSGIPVRWSGGGVKLDIAGVPTNASGLSPSQVFTSVVHSLQRWKTASAGAVQFDYWQGTDPSAYEADSNFNGLSSIYFSSASGKPKLASSVLGLTQVWYDTRNGKILETDIELNDRDFRFTTNSRDTSGYGSASSSPLGRANGARSSVFVENVITHELGHALGLSHSGGLQSTMLFMESPEQARLGCDDSVAIHALYPTGDAGARSSISGTVVSESGAALFGAHVVAISRRRGVVLATAITDPSGHYSIGALEPGTYFLMVEPFYAGASPLPSFYAGINTAVCGGRSFGRTFLTDSDGVSLQPVNVGAGQGLSAPTLVARCGNSSGASVSGTSASSSRSTAPVIYTSGSGFGASDRFRTTDNAYYRLNGLSGRVEIHAMAYSLYSPVRVGISLIDSSGRQVSVQQFDDSYEGESGYVNYDSYLVASNLPAGDYYVRVSSQPMDASLYPAGPVSLDSVPFLVITGSVRESQPPLASALAVNGRCVAEENFAAYSSPPGNPPRHSTEQEDDSGVGFCGQIQSRNGGDGGSIGGGPGSGAVAGWFAPWFLMAAIWAMTRASQRSCAGSGPRLI